MQTGGHASLSLTIALAMASRSYIGLASEMRRGFTTAAVGVLGVMDAMDIEGEGGIGKAGIGTSWSAFGGSGPGLCRFIAALENGVCPGFKDASVATQGRREGAGLEGAGDKKHCFQMLLIVVIPSAKTTQRRTITYCTNL